MRFTVSFADNIPLIYMNKLIKIHLLSLKYFTIFKIIALNKESVRNFKRLS